MNVIHSDHSLLKTVFLLVAVLGGATFCSGLAIANLPRQQATAQATLWEAGDTHELNQLTLIPRAQNEIEDMERAQVNQWRWEDEVFRMATMNNERHQATRTWLIMAVMGLALLLVGGLIVIVLYVLLVVAQRWVDRLIPARPAVAFVAPVARPTAAPPYDPWRDPAYRQMRRRQARQREQEARRRQAEYRRLPEVTLDPLRSNGHGPLRRPIRQRPE